MKRSIILHTGVALMLFMASCTWEENNQPVEKNKPTTVKVAAVKSQVVKKTKTYFGQVKFAKSTDFKAQQSGILSILRAKPGQKIKKGEVLAIYPPINHQLQIQQAEIELKRTQKDYKRQKALLAAGAVSRVSVEALKSQMDVQEKSLEQLQRVNRITAPFDGVITRVYATKGQEVEAGAQLFSMAQLTTLEVDFYLLHQEVAQLKLGTPVYFIHEGKKVEGEVTKKSFQMDAAKKAYQVTALFKSSELLYTGNTVELTVDSGEPVKSIWVPVESVKKQGSTSYVFVTKEGRAVSRKVKIGDRDEKQAQVIKGLEEGEQLITAGVEKVENNMVVTIVQ